MKIWLSVYILVLSILQIGPALLFCFQVQLIEHFWNFGKSRKFTENHKIYNKQHNIMMLPYYNTNKEEERKRGAERQERNEYTSDTLYVMTLYWQYPKQQNTSKVMYPACLALVK